ncbi:MAG: type II toxin-antitoxin system HicA family toxin [Candidatus Eremiobacteraeota bacterium]|nr:type II toxin-antitoxin system HicA family toxin [Candidatus Eremiobacteraeota bacterium]
MIKLFKKHHWKIKRTEGSHYIMFKKKNRVSIPHHTRDLSKKAERNYLKALSEAE